MRTCNWCQQQTRELDTHLCDRIAKESREAGRREERAKIVSWLMDEFDREFTHQHHVDKSTAKLAACIERGDHEK